MSDAPLSWDGGRLDGTPWQGIRFLSIEFHEGEEHPAIVTAHLNRPVGSLTADHVLVTGGRRLPVPPYEVAFAGHTVTISFRGIGDHSPYAVELTDGGGAPLHPFFASAEFRFTIDCDAGDCRESPTEASRPAVQPPAVDLLTKDFNGFVGLLADWVKVRSSARRRPLGRELRAPPARPPRLGRRHVELLPGPRRQRGLRRDGRPALLAAAARASARLQARRRARADDAARLRRHGLRLRARRAAGQDADLARRGAGELHRLGAHARARRELRQPAAGRRLPRRAGRRAARRRHGAAALGPRQPAAGGGPARPSCRDRSRRS